MNHNDPVPSETIRQLKRKNWLWLLVVPPVLSLSLVSVIKPAGHSASVVELAIICLCSFFCGFVLAVKNFKTSRQRFWGGLAFSGGSLYLVSCIVFLGCISFPSSPMTPAQIESMNRQQEIQNKAMIAKQLYPRDAEADSFMLDLSAFYNQLIPGQGVQPSAFNRFQKSGTHTWNGIKFDARGMARSYWNGRAKTNSIPVGQKCSEIDFLHGTDRNMFLTRNMIATNTAAISQFVIHFANGINVTVPIVYGKDVASSYFFSNFSWLNSDLTNSVVWQEQINPNASPRPVYGFYIKQWQNPFPDEIVASIDFEPVQTYFGAFLVAITLQPPAVEKP